MSISVNQYRSVFNSSLRHQMTVAILNYLDGGYVDDDNGVFWTHHTRVRGLNILQALNIEWT